jgi:hypothetical protein
MCVILLIASSQMVLMTNAPERIPEGISLLDRFRAKSAMARKQPVDAYIGTRYK